MRKFIVLALLAVSVNCHAFSFFDIGGPSIMEALEAAQKQRAALLEKQLQEQMRLNPAWRAR